jgi:hypothetical protein
MLLQRRFHKNVAFNVAEPGVFYLRTLHLPRCLPRRRCFLSWDARNIAPAPGEVKLLVSLMRCRSPVETSHVGLASIVAPCMSKWRRVRRASVWKSGACRIYSRWLPLCRRRASGPHRAPFLVFAAHVPFALLLLSLCRCSLSFRMYHCRCWHPCGCRFSHLMVSAASVLCCGGRWRTLGHDRTRASPEDLQPRRTLARHGEARPGCRGAAGAEALPV